MCSLILIFSPFSLPPSVSKACRIHMQLCVSDYNADFPRGRCDKDVYREKPEQQIGHMNIP